MIRINVPGILRIIPLIPLLALVAPLGSAQAGFVDRTSEAGLLWFQTSWGAALADLDADGDLDIYAGHHFFEPILFWNDGTGNFDSTLYELPWSGAADRHGVLPVSLDFDADIDLFITHGGQGGAGSEANELYRNDGNGVFLSLSGAAGMDDPPARTRCASAADFNGDFRLDVWVGKAVDATDRNSLFRNDDLFVFTDVAAAVGLDEPFGTVGGIWGDIDDDGDPDLLVGGEEFLRPTKLFRNDAGTFENVTAMFTPSLPIVSGADWGDYDNDGDLDLAVCDGEIGIFDTYSEGDSVSFFFNTRYNDSGLDGLTVPTTADTVNATFRIRGFLDFESIFLGPAEVNPAAAPWIVLTDDYVGAPTFTPGVDRGVWVWRDAPGGDWQVRCSTPNVNFDTFDGWLTDGGTISSVVPLMLEDPGFTSGGPRIWRNDASGFLEVTAALSLPAAMVNPRDISWVDYDNDGDLDLHVVDMGTSANPNAPDALFVNDGGSFRDFASSLGVTGSATGMGDCGVWGDIDNDGDLDLYLMEGAGPNTFSAFGPSLLLRNDLSNGFGSIQLELTGRESGRHALGTKATVHLGPETISRTVTANAWRGCADPQRLHFGLGSAAHADSVVIEWPFGTADVYRSLPTGVFSMEEGGFSIDVPLVTSAGSGWRIESVQPQPARAEQTILLAADRDVMLEVTIHDVAGRVVRRLHDGHVPAGSVRLAWDGRDDRGRVVTAGVYFVRVEDGHSVVTRKSVRVP